jgi:putative MATE family efflux protein
METLHDFTKGKILGPLLKFAYPVFLALFLQAMYGAVDLLVVGKFAETADVSGVATGSQIMQSITSVITSMSIGITILLGQKIGEGKSEVGGKVIGTGITLFAALAAVCTLLFVALAPQISTIMQAPEKAFSQTVSYVRICSAGTVFIIAFNLLGSIFRGLGDSKMPLITVAIACVVNIFGDLLLVAVFKMGTKGAAYATVFAQAISVVLSLAIISRRTLPFTFSKSDLRIDKKIGLQIFKFGAPVALQELLVSLSFLVIFAIVNSLGLTQSAGVGVAEKICSFLMLVASAYMQSLSAFVAQNIGANRRDRAKLALKYGILTSLAAGAVMGYLSFFHGDALSSIFSNDAEVVSMAADYLKAYGIDCVLTAFLFCFCGYYSGCGKTTFTMAQGIAGAFLVRIPFSYFMSRVPGISLFYIGLATPASTVVQITLCLIYFAYTEKKAKQAELKLN